MKYCAYCGKENEAESSFCTGCGQKFPAGPNFQPQINQNLFQNQQVTMLMSEIGPGAHKHTLTDFYLKDPTSGEIKLVARRPSLLHRNYNLVDKEEVTVGYVAPKEHLSHTSLMVENLALVAEHIVQVSNFRQKGIPPKCWVDDANGNKELTVENVKGYFGFSGIDAVDGSKIFDSSARSDAGGGVRAELSALAHRSYSINLYDANFPLDTLLTIMIGVLL